MSEYLVLYICQDCYKEHYFEIDSIPGGKEHCEYCEACGGKLELVMSWAEKIEEIKRMLPKKNEHNFL